MRLSSKVGSVMAGPTGPVPPGLYCVKPIFVRIMIP